MIPFSFVSISSSRNCNILLRSLTEIKHFVLFTLAVSLVGKHVCTHMFFYSLFCLISHSSDQISKLYFGNLPVSKSDFVLIIMSLLFIRFLLIRLRVFYLVLGFRSLKHPSQSEARFVHPCQQYLGISEVTRLAASVVREGF